MKYNVVLFISYLDKKAGGKQMNYQGIFMNCLWLLLIICVVCLATIIVYATAKEVMKGRKKK